MGQRSLVVVTGGAGFIGSHLVEALLRDGHTVRVVDDLSTGRRANLAHLAGRYDWVEGDLADFDVARRGVEGAEFVFHQAAIPSVPRSVREPLLSHASGPTATLNVLEAARQAGARRFVFAASSSAYGDTDELPKHEAMLPAPLSPYAVGKLAGEHYVAVYARTMGLDGVSLRYFNVFGPRQDPSSPYSGVISRFAAGMGAGRAAGDLRRRLADPGLHLRRQRGGREPGRDAGRAAARGRRAECRDGAEGQPAGAGRCDQPGAGDRPGASVPRRRGRGDVRDSRASLERARALLGYEPSVPFEEGLARTLQADPPGPAA